MSPENQAKRDTFDKEHSVTDPTLKALTADRARAAVDRASEVAKIAGVVTIRTNPQQSTSGNQ